MNLDKFEKIINEAFEIKEKINVNSDKSQVETNKLINSFSKNSNKLKNKESIVIVKKGQTFSAILDEFNFKKKTNNSILNWFLKNNFDELIAFVI